MPPIHHQQSKPYPGIDSFEIQIPDDKDLGTGTFTTVVSPNSLKADSLIASSVVNPPNFQISATFNHDVTVVVNLGTDEKNPFSTVVFTLPAYFKRNEPHTLAVSFAAWKVFSATFDGKPLKERNQPAAH